MSAWRRIDPLVRPDLAGPCAWRIAAAVALIAAGSPTSRAAQPSPPSGQRGPAVIIEGMRFDPPVIVVRRGQRITWINEDPFPHTVTAASGAFDSHLIAPGASWSYVARHWGEYRYRCTLHVTMKGRIEVR